MRRLSKELTKQSFCSNSHVCPFEKVFNVIIEISSGHLDENRSRRLSGRACASKGQGCYHLHLTVGHRSRKAGWEWGSPTAQKREEEELLRYVPFGRVGMTEPCQPRGGGTWEAYLISCCLQLEARAYIRKEAAMMPALTPHSQGLWKLRFLFPGLLIQGKGVAQSPVGTSGLVSAHVHIQATIIYLSRFFKWPLYPQPHEHLKMEWPSKRFTNLLKSTLS